MTSGQTIKCRAAIAWKPNEPLSLEEIQVAPPKAGEIRIKIISTAICHSDVHTLRGEDFSTLFPSVLGHEGAGIVESIGEHVTEFKPGDHVLPICIPQCKNCRSCFSKKSNVCDQYEKVRSVMPDGTTRFTCKGQQIFHYLGCSTFSEYTVVSEISLCKINPTAPLNRVCLLACGISSGYGAPLNVARVQPGSTCAVFGLGAVGLSVVMGCKCMGAKQIIGIDINESKRQIGEKLGITSFINPNNYDKPIQEVLMEITDVGLDYTFECTGNIHILEAAFDSCTKGWGIAVAIGLPPSGQELSITPRKLLAGRTLKGSALGGWKSKESLPELVEKYLSNEIPLDDFVTAELPFVEINRGFELLRNGIGIRTVLSH